MTAEEALRAIAGKQLDVVGWLRDNGIVFDDWPPSAGTKLDPKNWQHVAGSIYTELCEIDTIARHGLGIEVGDPVPEGWPEPAPLPADYWETAE